MRKILPIFLLTCLSLTKIYAEESKVLATYNGQKVTEAEVMKQFKETFKAQPSLSNKNFSDLDKNTRETLVKGYISGKLLIEEAKKSKVDETPEFKEKLQNIKLQLVQQELIDKYIKQRVTDQEIDKEYQSLINQMKDQDEVKASHILIDSEEKAKALKARLKKGANFAELAKQNSKDQGSKASGGALGYFSKGQVLPAIEQKVYTMKIGDISDPIKTDYGWHIVKLEDKRKVKIPSKEEAKNMIVVKLSKQSMEKYLEELLSKANLQLTVE